MNPRILAVRDTVCRVKNGLNPYDGGPFDTNAMMEVANEFSTQVQHDHFVNGLQERIQRGEDATEWIQGYMSVVFAQGFSAGSRYEMLEKLGDRS